MSVTMQRMSEREEREQEWSDFLITLDSWQLHALFQGHGELIAHDNFVDGLASLADIRMMLAVHAGIDVSDPRD